MNLTEPIILGTGFFNIIIIYGPEWQFLTWLATSSTSRGMSRSTVISASPRGQCSK